MSTDTIEILPGIGSYWQTKLKKLNIYKIPDLLLHLPIRYIDKTKLIPINSTVVGEYAQIEGLVTAQSILPGKKRRLQIIITDNTDHLSLLFFHFSPWLQEKLKIGTKIRCFGQIRFDNHIRQMVHPECKLINHKQPAPINNTLTPVYYLTQGLHQLRLQNFTKSALENYKKSPPLEIPLDCLPHTIQITWIDAIQTLHFPIPNITFAKLELMHSRLAFEELLAHHLQMRINKKNRAGFYAKPLITIANTLEQKLRSTLPFTPTSEQEKVYQEIKQDLQSNIPMIRLIQGDVGCGKTLVAALSALYLIEHDLQVALLVPTELLALQHLTTLSSWFTPLNIMVSTLLGGNRKQKNKTLQELKDGKIHLLIGTHALLQPDVEFNNLGLIIIDEQHRFGVEQREALYKKAITTNVMAHQLILSATPIPRTLAQTFYADLHLSNILTLPPGRKPTITIIVNNKQREEIIYKIQKLCATGAQVYWVCPAINEQTERQLCSAEEIYRTLLKTLPEIPTALIHGKILRQQSAQIMCDFKSQKIQIIVATTIIEVGVDVPNATVMVIENAEHFGLAQLHQLRGRVGRSNKQSYCILLYNEPLSPYAKSRLLALRKYADGFSIAEEDLRLRGPGEIFGNKQSGDINFKVADLSRDQHLLPYLAKTADLLEHKCPEIILDIIKRWLCVYP